MVGGLKRVGAAIRQAFDVRDVFLVVGLCLTSAGLAMISVPASMIVPGAVLTYIAVFGVKDGDR